MGGEWIFVPGALEVVQFVIEVAIINVDFVRVDTNDGTCIWRISLHSLRDHEICNAYDPKSNLGQLCMVGTTLRQ